MTRKHPQGFYSTIVPVWGRKAIGTSVDIMLRARSQKRRCGDLSGPLIEPDVIGHQAVHPPLVASVQVTGFVLP